MSDYLEGLNEEQRAAVLAPLESNILIVAGAGTGKTTTLSRRVIHLLRHGVMPGRIVCCTFTNKATAEMRERITRLAGDDIAARLRIGTLHSLAGRIVGTHHARLGIEKRPIPLDEDASMKLIVRAWQLRKDSVSSTLAADIAILSEEAPLLDGAQSRRRDVLNEISANARELLGKLPSRPDSIEECAVVIEIGLREARATERTYALTGLSVIERLQLQGLWPPGKVHAMGAQGLAAVRESMITEKEQSLFVENNHGLKGFMQLYQLYMDVKKANCVMDFGDMVVMATRILRENPEILKAYHDHYDYLMVDECQDLNSEQYAFIRVLSGDGSHLRVLMVGDQDQSIYAFRGANCMLMGDPFRKTFDPVTVMLTRNYRSAAGIVDLSNRAISLNVKRIPKALVAENPSAGTVHLRASPDETSMATWIMRQVTRMVESGIKPSEIAMISRRNDDLPPVSRALTLAGIPNRIIGSSHMFEAPAVKEAVNWAILCLRPERDDLASGCLTAPSVGLGEVSIARLESEAMSSGMGIIEYLRDCPRALRRGEQASLARFDGLMRAFATGRVDILMDAIVNGQFSPGSPSMRSWNESLKSRGPRSVRFLDDLVLVAKEVQARIDEGGPDLDDDDQPLHAVEEMLLFIRLQAGEIGMDDGGLVIGDGEDVDAVQLMTIHKVKGLEFDAVFYLHADDTERVDDAVLRYYGEFAEPNGLSDVVVGDVEENRRLAYVSLTRPRRILVLTRCDYRMINGTSLRPGWSDVVRSCFHDLPA